MVMAVSLNSNAPGTQLVVCLPPTTRPIGCATSEQAQKYCIVEGNSGVYLD